MISVHYVTYLVRRYILERFYTALIHHSKNTIWKNIVSEFYKSHSLIDDDILVLEKNDGFIHIGRK